MPSACESTRLASNAIVRCAKSSTPRTSIRSRKSDGGPLHLRPRAARDHDPRGPGQLQDHADVHVEEPAASDLEPADPQRRADQVRAGVRREELVDGGEQARRVGERVGGEQHVGDDAAPQPGGERVRVHAAVHAHEAAHAREREAEPELDARVEPDAEDGEEGRRALAGAAKRGDRAHVERAEREAEHAAEPLGSEHLERPAALRPGRRRARP